VTLSEIAFDTRDGVVCAFLTGDIDMSNVQEIRVELGHAVNNQALGLVLDLTEVDYLDSAGMQLVQTLRANLRSHGQRLALVIPSDSVINDALRLAGVDWAEDRMASCDEAVSTFGGDDRAGSI
jgi:anti-anti-sigma factor